MLKDLAQKHHLALGSSPSTGSSWVAQDEQGDFIKERRYLAQESGTWEGDIDLKKQCRLHVLDILGIQMYFLPKWLAEFKEKFCKHKF